MLKRQNFGPQFLRIGRGLTWREIAHVLAPEGDAPVATLAATLRKRFERLKRELKARARARDDVSSA